MSPWRLAWRQTRGKRALALVASLGILLTITLSVLGPLYLNTVERLAFQDYLDRNTYNLDAFVATNFSTFEPEQYNATRSIILNAAEDTLGDALDRRGVYSTAFPIRASLTGTDQSDAIATLTSRTGFDDKVHVVEGRRAQFVASGPIEVMLGREAADETGYRVGQQFRLNSRLPPPAEPYDAVLVGIVEPVDPQERYWFQVGGLYYERLDAVRNDAGLWVISLFLPEQTLVDRIGAETPSLLGNVTDTLYVNPDRLLDMGLAEADTALANLQGRLTADASRSIFISLLGNSLSEFRDEVARNQMPLVIVLVIVGAILLYSLTMIAFTVGRTTEGIVGLLRSRGAGGRRTVTLILAWALGAIVISAILAPLIAWGAIRGLGELGAWRAALDGASLMPGPIIPVLPWLAAGTAVTILIMAVPIIGVSRVPVSTLQSERSRPTNLPWFRRLHLDIVLLAIAAAILWQVEIRGVEEGVAVAQTDGAAQLDRTVLIVPIAMTLAALLLLYRLLPFGISLAAAIARAIGRLPIDMALERINRASTPAAALAGLLLLFGVLGVFVATFGGTLDKAAADQATFQAGIDVRIDYPQSFDEKSFSEAGDFYRSIEGVQDASAAYASQAGLGSIQVGTLVPMIGIEPSTIGGLLEFREDYAEVPMGELLIDLALTDESPTPPRVIPDGTQSVGVWVNPELPQANRFLWLQIIDGLGRPDTYSLGALDFSGWRFLETRLSRSSQPPPPGPYTLNSIMIYEPVEGANGAPGSFELDDFVAIDASRTRTVVEDFDHAVDWLPILLTGERRDVIETGASAVERRGTLKFVWGRDTRDGVRGIYVSPGASSIPVLASGDLLLTRGWQVGTLAAVHVADRLVPIRIVGTLSAFPTIEPGSAGFLVANGQSLIDHVNAVSVTNKLWPNRVFLSLPAAPEQRMTILDTIVNDERYTGEIVDRIAIQEETQQSPLASAGWRGMTLIALFAGIGALLIGVAAHAAGAASDRARDNAVLRALGVPRFTALFSFAVEYVSIVIPAGAGAIAVGIYLSWILVPRSQGLAGTEPVPSLILSPDWQVAGLVTGLICATGLGLAVALWRAYISQPVAWVLRGAEA